MLYSKLESRLTRLFKAAHMIQRFSATIYTAFLKEQVFNFVLIVILNFFSRMFNLAAFVISIQSIYIAFQSSASHGGDFKGKQYFDVLGLSEAWLPWLLAALVVMIFMMPGILKVFETRIIAIIAKENHWFCLENKVHYKTDLFVTQRVPHMLTCLCRFFSGVTFILIALIIVALFRIDLFLIVLTVSILIVLIVIFSNWRQIIRIREQSPKQSAYLTQIRSTFDPDQSPPIEEITIKPSVEREAHFNLTLGNWARINRMAIYQVGLMGFATATVVLFVFNIEGLDETMLFMLLYLVIAIRYAMTTAREAGLMASKIFDLRTETSAISEMVQARQTSQV
jgi:hypothetical protein